jgi:hypothetical protein
LPLIEKSWQCRRRNKNIIPGAVATGCGWIAENSLVRVAREGLTILK